MIDWRSYFNTAPDGSSYAKGAKVSPPRLEEVLQGHAVELWSDASGERFWLVADEADAARLGEPRGTVYTAKEARQILLVNDPATVMEIHKWKCQFDGILGGG